jgi:hypothetical protein
MKNEKEKTCRVVVVLPQEEKEMLQELASRDHRSMSNCLRSLLILEINNDFTE